MHPSKSFALKRLFVMILAMMIVVSLPIVAYAGKSKYDAVYKNSDTGYRAIIDDQADLITEAQEEKLLKQMQGLTEYGDVIYLTMEGYTSSYNTEATVKSYYEDVIGRGKSGFIFCAHCDKSRAYEENDYEGYDYVYTAGAIGNVITRSYCLTLTDNVYDEYYFDGAMKMFDMATTLMIGGKIAQPMKIICNILFGLIISLFLNYLIVNSRSSLKKASVKDIVAGSIKKVSHSGASIQFINQTRVYSPQSSGSSGGGHGGGGHGGGGHGGGHSH